MSKPQYLTKSRFKVGTSCPTKLHFLDNKEYGSTNDDNSFLKALAEGGFQVGELAKLYYPGGIEITNKDKAQAALETSELLKKENAVIYEAAFLFENLFIKADLVIKRGKHLELIEVKSKSISLEGGENPFLTKPKGKAGVQKINSTWESYLIDIAFQTHVVKKCNPKLEISSFLMLANKDAKASVDGLNQMFFLSKDESGRTKVVVSPLATQASVGDQLLTKINVDEEVQMVFAMTFQETMSFDDLVKNLSYLCKSQEFAEPIVGKDCKSCEFRIGASQKAEGLKSGFEKCWEHAGILNYKNKDENLIFEVWNFRKTAKLMEDGKYFVSQLTEEDISPAPKEGESGLSQSERQWLQIEKLQNKDTTAYIDIEGLEKEMKSWKAPYNFIDFETTMVAIPFHKGRKPYEQMAFQFSHHIVSEDGRISHHSEYINREKGNFPNFDFVRALKKALSANEGTIFRYAPHENTVLCQIRKQLIDCGKSVRDSKELIEFIEKITSHESEAQSWEGDRNMIDLCEMVKKYYYQPEMQGSNSIKKVLPAILNNCSYLQSKFSQPIYGTDEYPSHNFKNWAWIEKSATGKVIDPYKRLPPVFDDVTLDEMDNLITEGSIADGGAAMTAYARMQFTQMTEAECENVSKSLLRYCELDTFAMVMIFEHWKHEIEKAKIGRKAA